MDREARTGTGDGIMAEDTRTSLNSDKMTAAVLVAGAGPVGLALAAELGLLGMDCLVVEARDGTIHVPKMSQVSSRNMEFCRRWGIADKVKNAVWPVSHPHDFIYMESLVGPELARLKIPAYNERGDLDFTPEGACHCPQLYFDPILAQFVQTLPSVRVRYNTRLESFTEDDGAVHARLVDAETGVEETAEALYLVGCDGPGGAVREGLGIGLGGLGVVAHSINIFFRSPALAGLHDKGWARFYRAIDESGCWSELIAIDGVELWRLTVFDDPVGETEAADYLRKVAGRDFPFELISVSPWERRDVVADAYGEGRVFIAGDAAHQCSPTGGLGMHTGLEEAVNLAWKLAAVIGGWGGPGLLASYQAERRPVAHRNVALATEAYRLITTIPGLDAVARGEESPLAGLPEGARRYSLSTAAKNDYFYADSPICAAGDGDWRINDKEKTSQPLRLGGRAPHAWLEPGRSTLDLFATGFTLMMFGASEEDGAPLMEAAKSRRVPVKAITISDPAIADLYQRKLVLVRPDGHIAWWSQSCPAHPEAVIDQVRGAATGP